MRHECEMERKGEWCWGYPKGVPIEQKTSMRRCNGKTLYTKRMNQYNQRLYEGKKYDDKGVTTGKAASEVERKNDEEPPWGDDEGQTHNSNKS